MTRGSSHGVRPPVISPFAVPRTLGIPRTTAPVIPRQLPPVIPQPLPTVIPRPLPTVIPRLVRGTYRGTPFAHPPRTNPRLDTGTPA